MHRRCVRFVLTLASLGFASSLYAQSALPLRGQVFDETGAVISGARVTLVSADGQKRTAVANGNGEFTIANVPSGTYSLNVEASGFESYVESALNFSANSSPLKIIMAVAKVEAEIDVKPAGEVEDGSDHELLSKHTSRQSGAGASVDPVLIKQLNDH